jgi:hypothetical protein
VLNTQDTNSGDLGPDAAMASLTRIQNLGSNGKPDVILFFGGGNDQGRGVPLGSFDPQTAPTTVDLTTTKWSTFADAYAAAIMRLQHFYPDSQIVVMLYYEMPSYVTTAKLDKYSPVIKAICDHYGVPYVDESCTVGTSNNLVIYGHNMKNGSMFSGLVQYTSKEFFESHPVICFDTVDEPGQYQVIAAFRYNTNNETFKYNKHSDMDEAEFAEYVANCKSRSLYDTGITAEYGDMLITLSTCEYTYTNGRFVVVAKKIVE